MSKKKNTEVVATYYRIKMDDGWYGLDGEQVDDRADARGFASKSAVRSLLRCEAELFDAFSDVKPVKVTVRA